MFRQTLAAIISSTLLTAAAAHADGGEAAATARDRWTTADADGNGTLSKAEIEASMPTLTPAFAQIDNNGDGELSSDEMHNYRMRSQGQMKQEFAAADSNGSNMIDEAEAQAMPALRDQFATVDADKDGQVTAGELHAHHLATGEDWRDARQTLQMSDGAAQAADEPRSTTADPAGSTTTPSDPATPATPATPPDPATPTTSSATDDASKTSER